MNVTGTEYMPGILKKKKKQWRILCSDILLTIGKAQALSGAMILLHTGWVERGRNS